jgi:cyclic beta-1,2-glucan synthetase
MTGHEQTPPLPVAAEQLRSQAHTLVRSWNVVHVPRGRTGFLARIEAARDTLSNVYDALARRPFAGYGDQAPADPLLELRENPRMLRSVIAELTSVRKRLSIAPRLIQPRDEEEPRVAALANAFLRTTAFVWSGPAFKIFLDEVQKEEPLLLDELWLVSVLLKFTLLEEILAQAEAILHDRAVESTSASVPLSTCFKSLREVGHTDWVFIVESLVAFDSVLRHDPAQAYQRMDFDSREIYRKRVAEVAHYAECTEMEVAKLALELAAEAQKTPISDPRLYLRRAHVGYYLIDKGFSHLARRIGYRPPFIERLRMAIRNYSDDFYIGGIEIISVILIALIIAPLIPNYPLFGGLTVAFLLLFLPVTQGAVDLISNTVTALFKPQALPKLDFSKGIPADYSTLVAVPTLLIHEKQVRELVEALEVRFFANRDPNLHFALLTDLPDSITRPRENDSDQLVDLAIRLINDLNARYCEDSHGSFLLLHRHRIFNARQGVWMGWERKRGKLLDLNKYLKGEFDAFPVKAGNVSILSRVQYIITLDSDTQLPRGTAHQMVGAMAHPLNRAVIDPKLRIVTEGYGILQPRVGVSVASASRSRLAAIFSGQTGFDIYTRAISDVYQDLYGEGIFTGKGIYEVNALHAVLDRRFPRNSLLSHDLIEGSYARVGLTTDIEVIDDYPSHYSAYTRRKHRWVRGDWQIAQWLFGRVPDESGRLVRNPISTISRWKIFDNLRRSLVEPFTFILLLAGWLGLPGGPLYWTVATLFLLFIPSIVQLAFSLGRASVQEQQGAVGEAFNGFLQAVGITFFNLVFLPHQTLLSLDAIIRSLVRRFVTGQRLLEWETAAESESNTAKRTPVDRYLAAMPGIAASLAVLIALVNPGALLVALPILVLWGFATGITVWLNKPPREPQKLLSRQEDAFLREMALRIWRFYAEFGGENHNYLIPDNVEEDGLFEAPRVSPTNIGMLINARQAACQFGFLTAPEFTELTRHTLDTIERLDKFRGHVYNWYNTQTLEPLLPITVSSVDSGNLAASYYTLRSGALGLLEEPLLSAKLFDALRDHWKLLSLQNGGAEITPLLPPLPAENAGLAEWLTWSHTAESQSAPAPERNPDTAWWSLEVQRRIAAINHIVREYLPWLLPEFTALRALPQLGLKPEALFTVANAIEFAEQLDGRLARAWATHSNDAPHALLAEQLRSLLPAARARLEQLAGSIRGLAKDAERFAEEMEFGFLLEKGRQLLSIGYEVGPHKLHTACYDMLASEARIATFIAVAKGEIPQQSWFKLGRTHTMAFDRSVLLSWTGTMFEYLMPSLWMRSYPDTLVSRTLAGTVEIQRAFAQKLNIPWGISESGYAQKDDAGHYHYQAFGIPELALKWDATAGPVVSPYSSFLALGTDPMAALRNLRRMADAGWVGAYGFYEAADFTAGSGKPALVREWMAHHQGMSLLAILNLLSDNIVQRWFHANPHLQATELLLHEKAIREAVLKAEYKQFAPRQLPRAS